ncbi:MAG TPA: hypothetical protein EYP40_04415 [Chromatiales bacterium]|nr:hypothetical protein [Chromatiales bacterium]
MSTVAMEMASQNDHILSSTAAAHRCALKLAEDGYTVLSVLIEHRNPVVWVQNCAKCSRLRGASMVRRMGPLGRETIMATQLHGCQVQWVVRGH